MSARLLQMLEHTKGGCGFCGGRPTARAQPAPPRRLPAAQPVDDGQHVLRLRLRRLRDARRVRDRGAVHRLRRRARHARRPHRAPDRHDQRVRRRVRLDGRHHLVRHRAGDPVVRVGAAAARPPRLGGRLPVRRGGGDAPRALQHPERRRRRQAVLRRDAEPGGGGDSGGDGVRVSRRASTTTARRCRRWRWSSCRRC